MRQLLLDFPINTQQTLESFITGANVELLTRLMRIAQRETTKPDEDERFIYLWGESGVGKSHLLQALSETPCARLLSPLSTLDDFDYTSATTLYLIDDVGQLCVNAQVAAFSLFNQVREGSGNLVVAGNAPPVMLTIREDLRTRLSWGLTYQVHRLNDDDKIAALTHAAQARGLVLSASVLPYLMTHYARDLPALLNMLDALDRYSLETKRPITLPLLHKLLQHKDALLDTSYP